MSDAVAPDPKHPDPAGWHLATADWYPSDFVRPEYKPTAKYQTGPFALQLIMTAAPTPTVFGWAVKMADDKRRSLYRTVVKSSRLKALSAPRPSCRPSSARNPGRSATTTECRLRSRTLIAALSQISRDYEEGSRQEGFEGIGSSRMPLIKADSGARPSRAPVAGGDASFSAANLHFFR